MIWNFNKYRNNIAVITENGNTLTYSDLLFASGELARQIPRRCLIFNLCSNEIGSLLGYVAFLNHNIVPFLIEASLNRQLLYSLMDVYKPDYLWCPSEFADTLTNVKEVYSVYNYSLLKTINTNAYPIYEELALLLTTSGSTGSPKLVRQSKDNIKANIESIIECLKIDASERPITTLPMSYTYGLSIINTHLYAGASLIITNKSLMQREFWHQLKEFKATSLSGVPYTFEILEKLRFFRMNLPSLHTMTQAGGKLSPGLQKKFANYALQNGKKFVVMYGQTEATARMSYLPPEKAIEKAGSIGIAIPRGIFSLIDADGHEIVGPETTGELIYHGKNVTLGYATCGDDLSKGDERDGKLKTGDMVKRDADGYYYVVGRKKRFLKIYGHRINLDEVEIMLKQQFPEMECACAGNDDYLYVYITKHDKQASVRDYLVEKTGIHFAAFQVKPISKIPKNVSGKVEYKKLPKIDEKSH